MLRGGVVGDRPADKDVYSLDFGRALVQQGTTPGPRESDSGPLWGPGVLAQETPASIMSRNLHIWRKNNVQAPAAKAAEELDKLYAALPAGEVFDLTFQDMIDRNNSPRQRSPPSREDNRSKNYGLVSPKNNFRGANDENLAEENGQVKIDVHASSFKENENSSPGAGYSSPGAGYSSPGAGYSSPGPGYSSPGAGYSTGGKLRTALSPRNSGGFNENKKSGSGSHSIGAKLKTMALSPMTVFPVVSSARGQLSPTHFDELAVERRVKKQPPRRQVLYSDSTTPIASFRRESPFASPRASIRSDFGMQIGRYSFRDSFGRDLNLADSVRHIEEPQLEDHSARMLSADDMSLQQSLQMLQGSRNPILPTLPVMPPHNVNDVDCSICSATNLVLKISCVDCGEPFCLRCMDLETKDSPRGRQCKKPCTPGRSVIDGGSINNEKKGNLGCWTKFRAMFGSCTVKPRDAD